MKHFIKIVLACMFIPALGFGQKRAITSVDMWEMKRIGSMVLSPDGEWLAYEVKQYNIEKNSQNTDIYLVSNMGGNERQLTTYAGYDGSPCFSSDGSILAFISDRSGSRQIHVLPMDGGESQQITALDVDVEQFNWSPDGQYFAYTTQELVPEMNQDTTDVMQYKNENVRVIDDLFFRHWNSWRNSKRSYLNIMPATGGASWHISSGEHDIPPISLGSDHDFNFSPDGKEIAFVRKTDSLEALSTNNDIYTASSKGGSIRRITPNLGNDNQPVYSPDGKFIAYRAMQRPGFEADQYDLMLYNREKRTSTNLTASFDLDIDEIRWAPSSDFIYFTAGNQGRIVIFRVQLKNRKIKGLVHQGSNTRLSIAPDESRLYFVRSHTHMPHEIFSSNDEGDRTFQITYTNRTRMSRLEMNPAEEFWFPSSDSKLVHGFLVKPPAFDPARTYPAILLIHGGPQGAWEDEFHYRWNAQLFASRGIVVVMINPRGSKGYGQEFCNAVSKNWGGVPYRDLMSGLDFVLKKYRFIDGNRISAAGASYGGYMVNWIAGHTDRFTCLVSHAGLSNPYSFYGTTEELWFPEWEFDGTPYENTRYYERWSPLRSAKDFKTPMLVVHGEQDFRVPIEQGLQMFTALQRMHVPSRFLYFGDEGHFVNKPQNAQIWWQTVLDWIDQWNK
ncbi:S9 family peptidase [candidate division KSB1 bacterium]|nr:S9 family peptidase [candidate division KSB1 bacterium]